ncbi:hypothetical protein H9P43_004221 [Blastocladiella emersonii ATCC 22665]|nr:hypothetical protein H9P43_004221 [Blastocladiella emersonii ATCC 22665]
MQRAQFTLIDGSPPPHSAPSSPLTAWRKWTWRKRGAVAAAWAALLLFVALVATSSSTTSARRSGSASAVHEDTIVSLLTSRHGDLTSERLWKTHLPPLLVPRVPGTPTHAAARAHLVRTLTALQFHVELDAFNDTTPYGVKPFANIVATRHPSAKRRLVLAAHYDSMFMDGGREFIGATDSAAPCAVLLEVASLLQPALDAVRGTPDVTLQLVFFDGEEAWKAWSRADSLYGARHLAAKWASSFVVPAAPAANGPAAVGSGDAAPANLLQGISAFVLLDLLGAPRPTIFNLQRPTTSLFERLVHLETLLRREHDLLVSSDHSDEHDEDDDDGDHYPYFSPILANHQYADVAIEDDHLPFLERGVPVVHVIPVPFPDVWHKVADNASALDRATLVNFARIFTAFCVEQLRLQV